jgi:hypothetical protein
MHRKKRDGRREFGLNIEAGEAIGRLWPCIKSFEGGPDFPNGCCQDSSPLIHLICTRPKQHTGPHIGHNSASLALTVWFENRKDEEDRAVEMYIRLHGGAKIV